MAISVHPEQVEEEVLGDTYVQLSGVSWKTFEGLSNRSRGGRLTYDSGELEIMSPSIYHEDYGGRLRDLVSIAAEILGIKVLSVGSTTWKAPVKKKGIEADAAFYLDPVKVAAGLALMERGDRDITRFPTPDLAIEIEMRRPGRNRRRIYAAVGAVEVWSFNGKRLVIERIQEDGRYEGRDSSGWFPISAEAIRQAILDRTPMDEAARRQATRDVVVGVLNQPDPPPGSVHSLKS